MRHHLAQRLTAEQVVQAARFGQMRNSCCQAQGAMGAYLL